MNALDKMTVTELLRLARLRNSEEDNTDYDDGQFHLLCEDGTKLYPEQAQERLREITKALVSMGYGG